MRDNHLAPLILEGGDTLLQAAGPLLCLGQLGSQVLVDGVQLGVGHRLLEQLLLHLPPQLLQSCDLHLQLLWYTVSCKCPSLPSLTISVTPHYYTNRL